MSDPLEEYAICIRCGRWLDIDSDEFVYGEADSDGRYICEGCLTGEEEQAIAEDAMATVEALERIRETDE